jgi:RNA polymerase sigma-70 factor (ECF subfamily)
LEVSIAMNERDHLERTRRGDLAARDELFEAHAPSLSRSFPDDVSQDALLIAVRKLDGFEGASSFKTWLYAIANNVLRGTLRRDQRLIRGVGGDADPVAQVPDHLPAPIDILIGKERARLVRRAIDELPDAQREGVLLLMDGESFHAAGVAIGRRHQLTKYGSEQQLARALKTLADRLPDDL